MSLKSKVSLSEIVESEITKIQEDLVGVDESLRRLSGSFSANTSRQESRNAAGPRRNDEPLAKRIPQSGGVFARLGGVAEGGSEKRSQFNGDSKPRRRSLVNPESTDTFEGTRVRRMSARVEGTNARVRPDRQTSQQYPDDDEEMSPDEHEEEVHGKNSLPKPAVASSISRAGGSQSRMEAATLVTTDRASRDRNRRMFGALLGTLQSFRKDEAKQRDKEEQRMAVEKKLEKKGQEEQERMKREKRRLLEERRLKLLRVQQLADHAQRVKEHEKWAEYQMMLTNFIRTKSSPPVFWLPKSPSHATNNLIEDTAQEIQEEVAARREQLQSELQDLTEGLTSKHRRHRYDELPHSEEEGDLEYRDGEAGRAMVRRGKGKDEGGSSVDRSIDARDMLLDSRRQRANGDAGNRKRLRSESDVMCSRMVVQVGSGDRVVEVLDGNERPVVERHRKDPEVSKQVKSLKIKVERDTGPSEKESRRITIESSDKDNEKSNKKRKLKENSFSNDIEDEVSMMRRRIVEKARRLVKEEKVVKEVVQNGKTDDSARRKPKVSAEVEETGKPSNEKDAAEMTKVIKDEGKDKRSSGVKDDDKDHDSNVTVQVENVEDNATLEEIGARLEGHDVLQVRVETEGGGNGENEGEAESVDELQLTVDPKDSLMMEAAIEKENVSSGTPKVVKNKQESAVASKDGNNQISSSHRRSSAGRSDREKKHRSEYVSEGQTVAKKPRIDTTALKQDLLAITRSNQEKNNSRNRKAVQAIEVIDTSVDRRKNYNTEKTPEKKEEGDKHGSNERKGIENSESPTDKLTLTTNIQVVLENPDAERKNSSAASKDSSANLDGQQVAEQSKSMMKKNDKIKSGDEAFSAENIDLKKDVKIIKRTNEENKAGDRRGKTSKVREQEKKNNSLGVDGSSKNKASSEKERSRPKMKETRDSEKHTKTVSKVAGSKSEKKRLDKAKDSDSSSDEDTSDSDSSSSDTSSDSDTSVDSEEEETREVSKRKQKDSGSRTVSGRSRQKGKHSEERSKSNSGSKKSTSRR